MQNKFMELVEQSSMKPQVPAFEIGDTVDVHVRILEGEKERIQIFNGVVIGRSGAKTREMFRVRRIVQGEGVERVFPLHSPRIADVVVKRSGRVRRAKLYFLRERTGKAVRLKERFSTKKADIDAALAARAEKKAVRAEKKAAKAAKKISKAKPPRPRANQKPGARSLINKASRQLPKRELPARFVFDLLEQRGLEPLTLALQRRCSPN